MRFEISNSSIHLGQMFENVVKIIKKKDEAKIFLV